MDADEDQIRRLQRTAYGADATDAERARAVLELVEVAARGTGRDAAQSEGPFPADPAPDRQAPNPSGRGRLLRWTIFAGGVGLLLGAALGWGAGQRIPADSVFPSSPAPSESADPGTPLEDTALLSLFDRLPLADESTRVASVEDEIDPASVRLLATRVDGPAAYMAHRRRRVRVSRAPAARQSATQRVHRRRRLPADGPSILYGAEGYGLSAAQLDPTGTVSLGLVTF